MPEAIAKSKAGLRISDSELTPIFNDFVRRGILNSEKRSSTFTFSIPLFEGWLREAGMSLIMSDSLAEEYESAEQEAEVNARITSGELVELADKWEPYRGKPITTDTIRAWLEQTPRHQDQRLLFKLLQNVRFVSRRDTRLLLKEAHLSLHEHLPAFIQEKRSDRRRDVLITYVDGPGKSGATYASLYADENRISTRCVTAPETMAKTLSVYEATAGTSISALVIVDDVIGSGNSLSKNLNSFVDEHKEFFKERKIPILVITLCATPKGEQKVRDELSKIDVQIDLKVLEPMGERHSAFGETLGFWESSDEKGRAKELCLRLGAKVNKTNYLGYGDQGLLLVFPDTCPNNSLPILHGSSSGPDAWNPLFPRL
jgi:hypothetical protein